MLIHTPRLRLISLEAKQLAAIVRGPESVASLLKVSVPDQWPGIASAYAKALARLNKQPLLSSSGWWLYLFVNPQLKALVGSGGFKVPPDADGVVETGCEIAPVFRRQGYATEAVRGLIAYAFTRPQVSAVEAYSLPRKGPQSGLARAVGMARSGEAVDAVAGKVWRWEIARAAYLQSARNGLS